MFKKLSGRSGGPMPWVWSSPPLPPLPSLPFTPDSAPAQAEAGSPHPALCCFHCVRMFSVTLSAFRLARAVSPPFYNQAHIATSCCVSFYLSALHLFHPPGYVLTFQRTSLLSFRGWTHTHTHAGVVCRRSRCCQIKLGLLFEHVWMRGSGSGETAVGGLLKFGSALHNSWRIFRKITEENYLEIDVRKAQSFE